MRYDNIRSARAEENVIAQSVMEPALLDHAGGLTGAEFSAPILGRAYDALLQRHRAGLTVSPAVLEGFTPEEMAHLSSICQRANRIEGEDAFRDCVRIIREEHQKTKQTNSEADLLALQAKLKTKKGDGGNRHGTES